MPNEKRSTFKSILYVMFPSICIVLIAFTLKSYIIPIQISGRSMEPTIEDGSNLLIEAFDRGTIRRGDIVSIKPNSKSSEFLLKRVIGVAGDKIQIKDGEVFVNGSALNEPYIKEPMIKSCAVIAVTVPEKEIFVMGDNRNLSLDSRQLGTFKTSDVYGKYFGVAL